MHFFLNIFNQIDFSGQLRLIYERCAHVMTRDQFRIMFAANVAGIEPWTTTLWSDKRDREVRFRSSTDCRPFLNGLLWRSRTVQRRHLVMESSRSRRVR